MKPEHYVIAAVFSVLITALGFMLKTWNQRWETRLTAQDNRLNDHEGRHNEHDKNHATLTERLDHIKDTAEETRKDVKELLRQNGRQAAK